MNEVQQVGLPELLALVRQRTPARLLVGRSGCSYRTATQLELRSDHAAALDAVHADIDLERDFGRELIERWRPLEATSCAESKTQYLMRPDLGRRLSDPARTAIAQSCPTGCDLQIALGDGLSAAAVIKQAPLLLPLLGEGARQRGWRVGRLIFIRHCRVGVLNDIGAILKAEVVVLLIGERPGLATADSLSAYLAYRPQSGDHDARRNLVSNIHARGVCPEEASCRILALAEKMRQLRASGIAVKEELPATGSGRGAGGQD
jgi:ethanolamine ammonia-lyase small subunit